MPRTPNTTIDELYSHAASLAQALEPRLNVRAYPPSADDKHWYAQAATDDSDHSCGTGYADATGRTEREALTKLIRELRSDNGHSRWTND